MTTLRICRSGGHVGCCDDSPNRHATAHFHASGDPIIEGYDPPEGWGWCYAPVTLHGVVFDILDQPCASTKVAPNAKNHPAHELHDGCTDA